MSEHGEEQKPTSPEHAGMDPYRPPPPVTPLAKPKSKAITALTVIGGVLAILAGGAVILVVVVLGLLAFICGHH
jgi:hypothetical protein